MKSPESPEFPIGPEEENTITLPLDHPVRLAQLREKLKEYEERVAFYKSTGRLTSGGAVDAQCKFLILGKLLEAGSITYEEAADITEGVTTHLNVGESVLAFHRAFEVVEDYVKDGGKEVEGGTGLKQFPPETLN